MFVNVLPFLVSRDIRIMAAGSVTLKSYYVGIRVDGAAVVRLIKDLRPGHDVWSFLTNAEAVKLASSTFEVSDWAAITTKYLNSRGLRLHRCVESEYSLIVWYDLWSRLQNVGY